VSAPFDNASRGISKSGFSLAVVAEKLTAGSTIFSLLCAAVFHHSMVTGGSLNLPLRLSTISGHCGT